jgi:arginyl-tRNA synthetase
MSKRSGDFVTLREVVDEVGSDAVRFMMLFRKNDAVLDFDLAKVLEQSKDNPVFYVQYGHARGHSIFKNAREVVPDLPEDDAGRRSISTMPPSGGSPTRRSSALAAGDLSPDDRAAAIAHGHRSLLSI